MLRLSSCIICCLILVLSGCGTSYQPRKDSYGVGYREDEIDHLVYFVDYTVDDYGTLADAIRYWRKRSAELCQSRGKVGFEVVDDQQKKTPLYSANLFKQYTGVIRCVN